MQINMSSIKKFCLKLYRFKKGFIFFILIAVIIFLLFKNHSVDHKKNSRIFFNHIDENLKSDLIFEEEFFKIKKTIFNDFCPSVPPNLIGNLSLLNISSCIDSFNPKVVENSKCNLSFGKNLKMGGSWEPSHCRARHRIAIVIPFKNRHDNLNTFLYNIHPFLQRQEIEYTIYVAEQVNDQIFNKGILMNAAFLEIFNKSSNNVLNGLKYDCIVYHDVDLLPTGFYNKYFKILFNFNIKIIIIY